MVSDFFATEITEITEKKSCYDGVRQAQEKCQLRPCVVELEMELHGNENLSGEAVMTRYHTKGTSISTD